MLRLWFNLRLGGVRQGALLLSKLSKSLGLALRGIVHKNVTKMSILDESES